MKRPVVKPETPEFLVFDDMVKKKKKKSHILRILIGLIQGTGKGVWEEGRRGRRVDMINAQYTHAWKRQSETHEPVY